MTTTAHEDQFTTAPEPVRQPYDTAAILRRNVAELELALRTQTELKEKAEAELAKLREQKPVAYEDYWKSDGTGIVRRQQTNGRPLYAAPVPATAVPYGVDEEAANRIALAVYDCKNDICPEPLLYAINRILAAEAHPLSVEGRDALLQSAPQAPAVPDDDALVNLVYKHFYTEKDRSCLLHDVGPYELTEPRPALRDFSRALLQYEVTK